MHTNQVTGTVVEVQELFPYILSTQILMSDAKKLKLSFKKVFGRKFYGQNVPINFTRSLWNSFDNFLTKLQENQAFLRLF